MAHTYGIVWGKGEDTHIAECGSFTAAHVRAQDVALSGVECDVVELEGSGPVCDCDGRQIAPTHAPKRTIQTYRVQHGRKD